MSAASFMSKAIGYGARHRGLTGAAFGAGTGLLLSGGSGWGLLGGGLVGGLAGGGRMSAKRRQKVRTQAGDIARGASSEYRERLSHIGGIEKHQALATKKGRGAFTAAQTDRFVKRGARFGLNARHAAWQGVSRGAGVGLAVGLFSGLSSSSAGNGYGSNRGSRYGAVFSGMGNGISGGYR